MIYLLKIFKKHLLGNGSNDIHCNSNFTHFYDPQDACLDSGYCKEGLPLNIEGKKIIVNEQTCLENNGIWYSNKKVCHFK